MIVRVFIWGVFESSTTIDELRDTLAPLDAPSTWLWNEASERFGALVVGDELPDGLAEARALIGREPDAYEEFDTTLAARNPRAHRRSDVGRVARRSSRVLRQPLLDTGITPLLELLTEFRPVAPCTRSCR